MKPGDCYLDDYYEPDTVVLKVTEIKDDPGGYKCRVVYTTDSNRMEMGEVVSRWLIDDQLIPVAMITIDDKLMIIKL
jgi:hypothetical protein